jgi:hypothetical protein
VRRDCNPEPTAEAGNPPSCGGHQEAGCHSYREAAAELPRGCREFTATVDKRPRGETCEAPVAASHGVSGHASSQSWRSAAVWSALVGSYRSLKVATRPRKLASVAASSGSMADIFNPNTDYRTNRALLTRALP